uniref:Uncharacterized protein MANES_02G073900 n=1 Tax=Rhizophora mucronata TaxID=61149 RepID=A0A2P2QRM8_RHIMU
MAKSSKTNSNSEEPNTAPEADRWYNITLGSSFRDPHSYTPSPKFCTLRYEFKPASIDKSQPGSLHKVKDNKVTVEYHNNQRGKPKVTFEGVSEDYKENDAVLFFDGETFHLERLHRAVKRLRHVRLPGDSAAVAATTATTLVTPMVESHPSPLSKGAIVPSPSKGMAQQMLVEVEKIDIDDSEHLGSECRDEKGIEQHSSVPPNSSSISPGPLTHESEEHVDIFNADDNFHGTSDRENASRGGLHGLDIDINLPHQAETDDDEIADVDISGDEADKGPNAAEALRAQVHAEGRREEISSSSSSSSSDSSESENGSGSGSRSGTSSSGSESSDGDSVISI